MLANSVGVCLVPSARWPVPGVRSLLRCLFAVFFIYLFSLDHFTRKNPENALNAPEIIKTHENLKKVTETTDNPENAANTPEIIETHENL